MRRCFSNSRTATGCPSTEGGYGEEGNTIVRWTELTCGGHFAAMEVPVVWAEEVAAFFASLRS
ncbi:hypothetical protein [Aminobacter sp. HY435]|uniref:hypothetical protein n=1 Tax=Aminobacter sp. HY435 TaxID=2970917 RepID=UPI0022B9858B|nr:hypothetical protein [Aminobacter sp. HY435]